MGTNDKTTINRQKMRTKQKLKTLKEKREKKQKQIKDLEQENKREYSDSQRTCKNCGGSRCQIKRTDSYIKQELMYRTSNKTQEATTEGKKGKADNT